MKFIRKIQAKRAQRCVDELQTELVCHSRSMWARYGGIGQWPLHGHVRKNDLRRALVAAIARRDALEAS